MTCLTPGLEPEKACLRDFSGNFLKKKPKNLPGDGIRSKVNRY
jgi:hypothetical protein